MYFKILLIVCLILGLIEAHPSYTVHKARYCKNYGWFWCMDYTNSDLGSHLSSAGISSNQRKFIYYSLLSKPSKSSIKYIAIFASGQQGLSGEDSKPSTVSGAMGGYRDNFNKEGGTASAAFHSSSMAVQFHQNSNNQFWPASETLIISLPNHNFNQMHSSNTKNNYLTGYANYLNSLVHWSNIKGIYIAGYSRGGCLALRLSQKLRSTFSLSNVKFIVQSLDGVCRKEQSEFGTYGEVIYNPLPTAPSYFRAYKTDLNGQFPASYRPNFCIRHLAGGQDIAEDIGLTTWVRTFSHKTSTSAYSSLSTTGFKWYEQQWTEHGHGNINNDYSLASDTITPMLNHFKSCKSHFGL